MLNLNCPATSSGVVAMFAPVVVVTLTTANGDTKLHVPPTVDSTTMFDATP